MAAEHVAEEVFHAAQHVADADTQSTQPTMTLDGKFDVSVHVTLCVILSEHVLSTVRVCDT